MDVTAVLQHQLQQYHIQSSDKMVVGVSGGVDSMVLLDVLRTLPQTYRPTLYVAHINHQLREVSHQEEQLVADYCDKHGLPFFSTKWEQGPFITKDLENQARLFRYAYFETVLQETKSDYLVTGHHQDDQIETMLMRFLKGYRLETMTGISPMRPFGQKKLMRPFLGVLKEDIRHYAIQKQVPYCEDESNASHVHLRNRIRHTIRPQLEEENPLLGEGLLQWREDIIRLQQQARAYIMPLYHQVVTQERATWVCDFTQIPTLTMDDRVSILEFLLSSFSKEMTVPIGRRLHQQALEMVRSEKAHQCLDLGQSWELNKSYQKIKICKKAMEMSAFDTCYELSVNTGIFLSETEWIGCYEVGQEKIPVSGQSWERHEIQYYQPLDGYFLVRKRQDGDRFIYDQHGKTKKVSRYFIDEKIPLDDREKSWVVVDQEKNIIWIVPFRESYLSIPDETDKIHYKLIYCYQGDK